MAELKRTELSVKQERAVLVGVILPKSTADPRDPLGELASLAKTAGAKVVGQIIQPRSSQELDDPERQIGAQILGTNITLFRHLDLLSQLVAHALQALSHHDFRYPGSAGETCWCPAAVVTAVTQSSLLWRQLEQRRRKPAPLDHWIVTFVDTDGAEIINNDRRCENQQVSRFPRGVEVSARDEQQPAAEIARRCKPERQQNNREEDYERS